MSSRDKVFLLAGIIVGLVGIVATLVWDLEVGIITLLLLNLLNLLILVLQRRQLGRIQQRTLALLQSREGKPSQGRGENPDTAKIQHDLKISNKKLVGLLQAQQANLDRLNEKFEAIRADFEADHEQTG